MSNPLKTLVQEYGWIHTGLGLLGNVAFFVGSVVFLPSLAKWEAVGVEWQTVGVWLFLFGAFLMLVGTAGNLLVKIYEAREKRGS
ncbi:YrhK family protein [Sulfitobacter sp. KE34]|uniref:YrhK family protein n=1 Tax=unclassified Sulfitobacter TaxID=196795 RepID=UPI0023E303EC|nr:MULTISPECIES: YrhK family protein [unclassified Sulfitobacter]MDF3352087.1 YrhK family protein [Sulfitobacter sp. KE12]MDF3355731.1 YrhK family protein [Sulfitobacter sp. KE27]MDF3359370.1 YrhK family protein [Sulfitobacter sp. KE33]MDF3366794.1 YrhK family protein [Sulfitobacter sp. Ks34]MDF3370412.1 YrhK family protein [Sulfitobacter sp. Ks43]